MVRLFSFLLLLALFVALGRSWSPVTLQGRYEHCLLLSSELDYRLYWRINTTENTIYVAQVSNSSGWMAVGLSADGSMDSGGKAPGSDIVVAYFDGSVCRSGCVHDYHALYHDHPVLDTVGSIEKQSGQVVDGFFAIEWRRGLTVDDPQDRSITPGTPQEIIWSANNKDTPGSATSLSAHTHIPLGGGFLVDFGSSYSCGTPEDAVELSLHISADLADFDLGNIHSLLAEYANVPQNQLEMTNYFEQLDNPCPSCTVMSLNFDEYVLTDAVTQYVCHGFILPNDKDRHIVAFDVVKDNTQVLHHILVYETPELYPGGSDEYVACGNMPPHSFPVWGWAPGTERWIMPTETGTRVGPSGAKFITLQVHYNNPGRLSGLRDSSGIKIWLTEKLRTYDSGMLLIGPATRALSIPPGQSSYHLSGGCSSSTTMAISKLPQQKFFIIGEGHHLHEQGRAAWTDISRNGNLIYRFETPRYDYNSQRVIPATPIKTLLPGDEIRVNCLWNTTKNTQTTVGCEATHCEMCIYLIMYYPQIPFNGCHDQSMETAGKSCDYLCS